MDRGFIKCGECLYWGTVRFSRIFPWSELAMTVCVSACVRACSCGDRCLQEGESCFFNQIPTLPTGILKLLFSPKSLYLCAKLHGVLFQAMDVIFSLYIPL